MGQCWFRKRTTCYYKLDWYLQTGFDLVSKYNVWLKTNLLQGLSEPEFSKYNVWLKTNLLQDLSEPKFYGDLFLASRESSFRTYFISTAAGVVPCGGRKTSPRT